MPDFPDSPSFAAARRWPADGARGLKAGLATGAAPGMSTQAAADLHGVGSSAPACSDTWERVSMNS